MSQIETDLKVLKETIIALQQQQEHNQKTLNEIQEAIDTMKAELEDTQETNQTEIRKFLQEIKVAVSTGGVLEQNQHIIYAKLQQITEDAPK